MCDNNSGQICQELHQINKNLENLKAATLFTCFLALQSGRSTAPTLRECEMYMAQFLKASSEFEKNLKELSKQ